MKKYNLPKISLIISGLLYAIHGTFPSFLSQLFSTSGQVLVRMAISSVICLAVFLIWRQQQKPLSLDRKQLSLLFLAGLFTVAMIFSFTFSVLEIKLSNTIFSLYIGSILSSLTFSKFIFKEQLTFRQLLGIICLGLALLAYTFPFNSLNILGLLAGLLAGILETSINSIRKSLVKMDKFLLVALQMGIGSAVFGLYHILFAVPVLVSTNYLIWGVAILSGLVVAGLSLLSTYGFQNTNLNLATLLVSSEIGFSIIIGAIILSQSPTPGEIVAGTLIFLGIYLNRGAS